MGQMTVLLGRFLIAFCHQSALLVLHLLFDEVGDNAAATYFALPGKTVGDIPEERVKATLQDVGLTPEMADDIYSLTSLAKFDDRFVIPAAHREQAIEMLEFAGDTKGSVGFGFKQKPERGW